MRIAIPVEEPSPQSAVSARFGRAAHLAVWDEATERWEVCSNQSGAEALQGAGIAAAQLVAGHGADTLLTVNVGPKAYRALEAAGIAVYLGAAGTAAEALQAWREGRLTRAAEANVEGHW